MNELLQAIGIAFLTLFLFMVLGLTYIFYKIITLIGKVGNDIKSRRNEYLMRPIPKTTDYRKDRYLR